MKIYLILLFTFFVNFNSCSDEDSTSSNNDDLVEIQFDLQTGFDNVAVSITENDNNYFHAIFTGIESLAGPQASFITYLSEGGHNIKIIRTQLDNITNVRIDSCEFSIGSSDKYWVGMSIYSDSLHITIQDSSFFYL